MQDRTQQLAIVQRMIDAGESEAAIASVIRHFASQKPEQVSPPGPPVTSWRQPAGVPMVEHGIRHADTVPTSVAFARARSAAPAVGAMIGAGLTGGASIPIQMLATGAGGALGQAAKDAPEEMSLAARLANMGWSGVGQATLQGAVSKVASAAPRMQQLARSLWNHTAKVTEPVAKTTQTMRAGGTLDQAKDEIAETVLSQGTGTIRRGNVETMRDSLASIDDAIDAIVRSSRGMVARQELRAALQARHAAVPVGTQAGQAEREAIARTFEQLNKLPPKMTVQKAQELKRYIYRTYEKTFAADATQAATAAADKTVARQLRASIAREEPAIEPLNALLSRQIPATKALAKAVSRTSNHDPVRLTSTLAGVVTNPATVAAALINHPGIGSFTAQQLYNAAKRLPAAARTAGNIIRIASITPVPSHETGR